MTPSSSLNRNEMRVSLFQDLESCSSFSVQTEREVVQYRGRAGLEECLLVFKNIHTGGHIIFDKWTGREEASIYRVRNKQNRSGRTQEPFWYRKNFHLMNWNNYKKQQ